MKLTAEITRILFLSVFADSSKQTRLHPSQIEWGKSKDILDNVKINIL